MVPQCAWNVEPVIDVREDEIFYCGLINSNSLEVVTANLSPSIERFVIASVGGDGLAGRLLVQSLNDNEIQVVIDHLCNSACATVAVFADELVLPQEFTIIHHVGIEARAEYMRHALENEGLTDKTLEGLDQQELTGLESGTEFIVAYLTKPELAEQHRNFNIVSFVFEGTTCYGRIDEDKVHVTINARRIQESEYDVWSASEGFINMVRARFSLFPARRVPFVDGVEAEHVDFHHRISNQRVRYIDDVDYDEAINEAETLIENARFCSIE